MDEQRKKIENLIGKNQETPQMLKGADFSDISVSSRPSLNQNFSNSPITLNNNFQDSDDTLDQDSDSSSNGEHIYDSEINLPETILLETNIYPINISEPELHVFAYNVTFDPEIPKSAKMNTHYIYSALFPGSERMNKNEKWKGIISDRHNHIFSIYDDLECQNVVKIHEDDTTSSTVTITKSPELQAMFYYSPNLVYPFIKAIIRQMMTNSGRVPFGLRFLNMADKTPLTNGNTNAQSFFGVNPNLIFISSISNAIFSRSCKIGVAMNPFSFVQQNGSLADYLLPGQQLPSKRNDLTRALKSFTVITSHLKSNFWFHPTGVRWDCNPSSVMFEKIDKKTNKITKISIGDYFRKTHKQFIPPSTPIIEYKHKDRLFLFPATVLTIMGPTAAEQIFYDKPKSLLNNRYECNIITFEKLQKIDAFMAEVRDKPETASFLAKWGVSFDKNHQIMAKVFSPPIMNFGGTLIKPTQLSYRKENNKYPLSVPPLLGSPFSGLNLLKNQHPSWLFVYPISFSTLIDNTIMPTIKTLAKEINFPLGPCDALPLENVDQTAYRRSICERLLINPSAFAIVLVPDSDHSRYSAIKSLLSVSIGIPSQIIRTHSLQKVSAPDHIKHIFTHVFMHITAKIGGIPYHIDPSNLRYHHTMIISLALSKKTYNRQYHFTTDPMAACTSTYDYSFQRLHSETAKIAKTDNIISDDILAVFLQKSISSFQNYNDGFTPNHILVYRTIQKHNLQNLDKEADFIKHYITNNYPDITSFSYVTVDPKAEFLLFSNDFSIEATTYIDKPYLSNIPHYMDLNEETEDNGFLLFTPGKRVGHPSRYLIIGKMIGIWTKENIAELTSKLLWEYPGWAGVIRIPSPALSAQKLADHSRIALNGEQVNHFLQDLPYYI